jgi:hypothetical protein
VPDNPNPGEFGYLLYIHSELLLLESVADAADGLDITAQVAQLFA